VFCGVFPKKKLYLLCIKSAVFFLLVCAMESGKRQLSTSCLQQGLDNKKICTDSESEMPAWARIIIEEVRSLRVDISVRLEKLEAVVGNMEVTLSNTQTKLSRHDTEIKNNTDRILNFQASHQQQQHQINDLTFQLNEQIDRSLRTHLTFKGIPRGDN
jgi:hypothetical protein